MANQKRGTKLNYQYMLLFEYFPIYTVKKMHDKLMESGRPVSLSSLYNWHRRWVRANREARDISRAW